MILNNAEPIYNPIIATLSLTSRAGGMRDDNIIGNAPFVTNEFPNNQMPSRGILYVVHSTTITTISNTLIFRRINHYP